MGSMPSEGSHREPPHPSALEDTEDHVPGGGLLSPDTKCTGSMMTLDFSLQNHKKYVFTSYPLCGTFVTAAQRAWDTRPGHPGPTLRDTTGRRNHSTAFCREELQYSGRVQPGGGVAVGRRRSGRGSQDILQVTPVARAARSLCRRGGLPFPIRRVAGALGKESPPPPSPGLPLKDARRWQPPRAKEDAVSLPHRQHTHPRSFLRLSSRTSAAPLSLRRSAGYAPSQRGGPSPQGSGMARQLGLLSQTLFSPFCWNPSTFS